MRVAPRRLLTTNNSHNNILGSISGLRDWPCASLARIHKQRGGLFTVYLIFMGFLSSLLLILDGQIGDTDIYPPRILFLINRHGATRDTEIRDGCTNTHSNPAFEMTFSVIFVLFFSYTLANLEPMRRRMVQTKSGRSWMALRPSGSCVEWSTPGLDTIPTKLSLLCTYTSDKTAVQMVHG